VVVVVAVVAVAVAVVAAAEVQRYKTSARGLALGICSALLCLVALV
jgi:hypothetical protein